MAETEAAKVELNYFQETGCIWNIKEWEKARRHRVTGTLIGNLAHTPHQVKEKGFPLMLTKNETTLLLEKGLAILSSCPKFLDSPSEELREKCCSQRRMSFAKQASLLKEQRRLEILEKAEMIVKGKLAKRRKMDPERECGVDEERNAMIQEELSKIADPAEIYLYIQTCTEDPWTSEEDRVPAKWTYPNTDEERLQYATYRALWEAGHWVTTGGKFGGDFLAYPGDPLLYHAHFIVRHMSRNENLHPLDVVAFSRLANSTRKTAVLAYFDANGTISFQSLAWVSE